jgi:hypothetical protein
MWLETTFVSNTSFEITVYVTENYSISFVQ